MKDHPCALDEVDLSIDPIALCESRIRSSLEASTHAARFTAPTVGVEQEFFVLKRDASLHEQNLAKLSDTQALLRRLSEFPHWNIYSGTRPIHSKDVLTRVSREHPSGRYTTLKYEYPPHLMEIAFTYFTDLRALEKEIRSVWSDLENAAEDCGLKIVLEPIIKPPIQDFDSQAKIDPKYLNLAQSRRQAFTARNEKIDPVTVDFPSYIAATQTQVAIPYWWKNERFMHRLYCLEPFIAALLSSSPQLCAKRLALYESVFDGLPLLIFPALEQWNLRNWSRALCLTQTNDTSWDSTRTLTLGDWILKNPMTEGANLLNKVRDLQLIRPKHFGAIEFRGDGSVHSVDRIIQVAATRFAASLLASCEQQLPNEQRSFPHLRQAWIDAVSAGAWEPKTQKLADEVLSQITVLLAQRGLSEELYLRELKTGAAVRV